MSVTCGEATMRLLARYGVTTVFGIPGVHTLDLCRGMSDQAEADAIRHVQTRNEQGAAFMAEGWARCTNEAGVAVVISGPGVTNASTALGQCYADSLPMLLISAEPPSQSIGKGWGLLHEISEQKRVTEPLCAFSASATSASDIPQLIARAFTIFASQRPRPVHISIPLDVQAEMVHETWEPVALPGRPSPAPCDVETAANLLMNAECPVVMVGGGATHASEDLLAIVEATGSIVIASTAGKGIIPDNHPLSLSASTVRPEVQRFLPQADVILAVGTELSETDSFIERLDIRGQLIRVDIDASKLNDIYPASVGIVADAELTMASIRACLDGHVADQTKAKKKVQALRKEIRSNLSESEKQHSKLLRIIEEIAPRDTIWSGDACQLVYTGAFLFPSTSARTWFYPAGFCALGNALPNAVGAKFAKPQSPVAVLAGDGGFMFTMPELMTAAQAGLNLPIIIWENGGLKQIQDDMDERGIPRVGVEGNNPDFVRLAEACGCSGSLPKSESEFKVSFSGALEADRPTVIVVREGDSWLT